MTTADTVDPGSPTVVRRRIAVCGAPSSLGIRPYDDSLGVRGLYRAPSVLRQSGLVERLAADDIGDVVPGPYRDFIREPGHVRNESALITYNRALADRVEIGLQDGRFTLLLGGDCSIVLGSMLGATRRAGRVGLVYIDAHDDFATPSESVTGSAASMCLGMAAGRGDSALAQLAGSTPLVRGDDIVLIGRRDVDQPYPGHAALEEYGVLDLAGRTLAGSGAVAVAARALERVTRTGLDGFWVHVDADVFDPGVIPAVDSPEPAGPGFDELVALVRPLVQHSQALGMQLTIYDPTLDPDGSCAVRLASFLEAVLTVR
jgi:arginase